MTAPTLIALACLLSGNATAQEGVTEAEKKHADAVRLGEVMGLRDQARRTADAIITVFHKARPDVPAMAWAEVTKAATDEMMDLRIELITEHLSDGEIRELIGFYETPIGKRLVEIDRKMADETQARLPELRSRLAERIRQRLDAAGYDPAALRPPAAVRAGGKIAEPKKIKSVPPEYPADAKAARLQGVVVLECTIAPNGTVSDVRVVHGPPPLSEAAVKAVRQWVYEPTFLNGVPVPVIMTVTVNFHLSEPPPAR